MTAPGTDTKTKHGHSATKKMETVLLALVSSPNSNSNTCTFNQRFQIVTEHERILDCKDETLTVQIRGKSKLKSVCCLPLSCTACLS